MNDEFQYLLDALAGKFGILIQITAWQGTLRSAMVFVNVQIQKALEGMLPADREWVHTTLNARWWRITAFILNAACSLKLPASKNVPNFPSPSAN